MLMRPNSLAFAVLVVLLGVGAAQAQTLNSEYTRLFGEDPTNCANLGANDSGADPDFGPGINTICEMPGAGANSSASGTGASSNAAETAANRREERLEESDDTDLGGGLNLFFAGDYENLHRHETTYESGYDSDIFRGTGGVDLLVGDSLLVGGFFTYAASHGDFRSGGDFDTDSYTPTLFASFLPMANMFVDVSVSYTRHEYDRDRRASYTRANVSDGGFTSVTGDASGDTHGDQIGATFAFGYDHAIENITVGPRAGLNFSYQNIDSFGENGITGLELDFRDQYVTSLQSVVGLEATMAVSTPLGVLSPRIGADYVHEFENDQRDIRVSLVQDLRTAPDGPLVFSFENQEPDRDYFRVGGGFVLTLPNGIQPFANFRTLVGNSHFDGVTGTVGVRLEM